MPPFPRLATALASNDNAAHVIVFEDLDLAIRIGAYASERHEAQRVRISIEILVVPAARRESDRLDAVVDYDAIHRDVAALADAPHVDLQETLAERIAALCLKPRDAVAAEVHVRKLDAYAHCGSVGIRVVRTKDR